MQKFKVNVDGGHDAEIVLEATGNTFTGSVTSPEYGTGQITEGKINGGVLTGVVSLAGHQADFSAVVSGQNITGKLKVGWFFNKAFTGTVA